MDHISDPTVDPDRMTDAEVAGSGDVWSRAANLNKQLQQVSSTESVNQERRRLRIIEKWTSFLTDALKEPQGHEPQIEDLELFLQGLPELITPRGTVPSLGSYDDHASTIRAHLTFQYKNWNLSPHDIARLKAIREGHLRDGRLTRERVGEAQWIGTSLLVKLVRFHYAWAHKWGPQSWDLFISETLLLVLQSALCSRSGDVAVSSTWSVEGHTMRHKDVDIRLVERNTSQPGHGNTDPYFVAKFNMRSSKGNRFKTATAVPQIVIEQLRTATWVFTCPVTLIIVQALRYGNVEAHSLHELIAHARLRADKKVVWRHNDWPVLVARQPGHQGNGRKGFSGTKPDPSLAATSERVSALLSTVAIRAGFLNAKLPTSHDIRRGALQDIATLPKHILPRRADTLGLNAAAEAGHHSAAARDAGVTAQYVGYDMSKATLWGSRLQWIEDEEYLDPFQTPLAPGGISEATRKFLSLNVRTNELDEVINSPVTGLKHTPSDEDDIFQGHADDAGEITDTGPARFAIGSTERYSLRKKLRESKRQKLVERILSGSMPQPDESVPQNEGNGLKTTVAKTELVSDEVQKDVLTAPSKLRQPQADDEFDDWDPLEGNIALAPNDFITKYSSINTYNWNQDRDPPPSDNSREPATRHVIHCKNRLRGCTYATVHEKSIMLDHEAICVVKPDEAYQRCMYPGCDKKGSTWLKQRSLLRDHMASHFTKLATCPACLEWAREGWENTRQNGKKAAFETTDIAALKNHYRIIHEPRAADPVKARRLRDDIVAQWCVAAGWVHATAEAQNLLDIAIKAGTLPPRDTSAKSTLGIPGKRGPYKGPSMKSSVLKRKVSALTEATSSKTNAMAQPPQIVVKKERVDTAPVNMKAATQLLQTQSSTINEKQADTAPIETHTLPRAPQARSSIKGKKQAITAPQRKVPTKITDYFR